MGVNGHRTKEKKTPKTKTFLVRWSEKCWNSNARGEKVGGAKPAQQKTLPTKVHDTGQDKSELGQHVLFCYLFSRTLVSDV